MDRDAWIPADADAYALGLLNSRLLTFRFRCIGKLKSGGIRGYFWNSISKLTIRRINLTTSVEKTKYEAMECLVMQMNNFQNRLANANLAHERTVVQRQIDRLVDSLYNLTSDEVAIGPGVAKAGSPDA